MANINVQCPGRVPRFPLYIARGARKKKSFALRCFSILAMFDCFTTLYKSLSVYGLITYTTRYNIKHRARILKQRSANKLWFEYKRATWYTRTRPWTIKA